MDIILGSNLSYDVLFCIFDQLDLKSLVRCTAVSRGWKNFLTESCPHLWDKLEFENNKARYIGSSTIKSLLGRLGKVSLKKLSIRYQQADGDGVLLTLAKQPNYCRHLNTLVLFNVLVTPVVFFNALEHVGTQLQTLEWGGVSIWLNDLMENVPKVCARLRHLVVYDCFTSLYNKDQFFVPLKLNYLKSLKLSNIHGLKTSYLAHILSQCSNLKHLSLRKSNIDVTAIMGVFRTTPLPKLKCFDFEKNVFSQTDMQKMTTDTQKSTNKNTLKELTIQSDNTLENSDLQYMLDGAQGSLEVLDLRGSVLISDTGLLLNQQYSRLETLCLKECFEITSQGLLTLLSFSPLLKSIDLSYLSILGWEEEHYWKRSWNPPPELLSTHQKALSPVPLGNSSIRQAGTAFSQPTTTKVSNNQPTYHPQATYIDYEFRTRMLFALESNLPNEVDWAFNTLIKFSYASENFNLDFIPTLIDLLLSFIGDFFEEIEETVNCDMVSKLQQERYERVLQVFHILRNFSFLEMNIRRLASHEQLRGLLMKGISLEPSSHYGELSRQCLDIMENMAPQVTLVNRTDLYLTIMTQLLFSNDRAFILGAIRALTRVAVTEANERILSHADPRVIERMAQFLLVDDEKLEAATLEYLYQYSSLRGDFSTQLIEHYPGNLIGLLTGFLSYKSSLALASTTALGTIHGIPAAQMVKKETTQEPSIPDLTNYANLDEPYRCLGWLKDQLISGTENDKIILKEVFDNYQKLFGTEKPLGSKEFYTVLKIAFPQPSIVEETFTNSATPLEVVLCNVKYSPTRRKDGPVCQWEACEHTFDDKVDLHKHIVKEHLESANTCKWMKCTKKEFKGKVAAIHHMRTHFAAKIGKHTPKSKPFTITKIPADESEVSGIPLTSALLLRNLARHKQHHTYYLPYQSELVLLAIQRPKVSKYILAVLCELNY
ncbi:Chromatin structure-remodeling complex protein rsc9 [Rhizopus stolonifer]|uniref:Chromatin structure-remodeling complex protein rsc9 n=1 Tax=Rhizopus stolonifer TaxID=4846 RepID=A0A367KMW5_RHIST|nr:Chromatin structure-remodeling complex protein rsc9 [Rhizopus stolonifer]